MKSTIFGIGAVLALAGQAAFAQDGAYIQIEAQPSLNRAEDRARDYASYLSDVNGFALGRGWYGIALGPYDRDEAEALLRRLRSAGQIPRDAYLEEDDRYARRFYPAGVVSGADTSTTAGAGDDTGSPRVTTTEEPAEIAPEPADQSPREARAAEAALTRDERMDLQVALHWTGHYDGRIDAAFGSGTRGAMAAWQEANNYERTGILTTRQRRELFRQYNAPLEGMGLERVTDGRAGIAMELPLGIVAFEGADSPFVRYEPTGDLEARVLLISEPGDTRTLGGLYEIMQTLEIVPREGPRERSGDSFTLQGADDDIVSFTEASARNGTIKGFTLIWPAGDEARRTRVLARMRESFERVPGQVLDPAKLSEDAQAVDLMAGMQVRQPVATASGFYVDGSGAVVTALDAVSQCGRITLDDAHEARIVASDEDLGAAVLRPSSRLSPREVASFRAGTPRLKSEVAVSGYSYGGVLSAPTLTFGQLEDLRGLDGNRSMKRLALAAQPGDAGGPVLDAGGAVLGMLLPREEGSRQLPDSVSFAADADALQAFLSDSGFEGAAARQGAAMAPEDLTEIATDMTVLVSCWK